MATSKGSFNVANLTRLARFGNGVWDWKPDQTQNGVLEMRSPSGSVAGYPGPPRRYSDENPTPSTAGAKEPRDLVFPNTDASAKHAQAALDATWRAREKLAAAARDERLAPQALHDDLVAIVTALLVSYVPQWAFLKGIRDRLDGEERVIFDPPQAGADLALDIEIRARVKAMDESAYLDVLRQLQAAELAPVLLALRRDPLLPVLPDRDRELIRVAWVAHVEEQQKQAVEDFRSARETNDWALGCLTWLAANIGNWSLSGSNGALDRFAIFTILAPYGALDLCAFTPAEVAAYKAKATNDAARAAAEAAAAAARRPVAA